MEVNELIMENNLRTEQCAEWGTKCPIHLVFHYRCAECGVDCTMGTQHGPATTETDGITRCYACNSKLQRFWAVGKDAVIAKAAIPMYEAIKQQLAALDGNPGDFQNMLSAHRALESAIAMAEGR